MRDVRSTEELARGIVASQIMEIAGYINPTQDGLLAPWMMAKDRAQRLVGTLQVVCDAISARPVMTLNPDEDAALDEKAARDANVMPCRGVDPFFATALNTVRPNWEAV